MPEKKVFLLETSKRFRAEFSQEEDIRKIQNFLCKNKKKLRVPIKKKKKSELL